MSDFVLTNLTSTPFAYIARSAPIFDIPNVMQEGFSNLSRMFEKAGAAMAGPPLVHYLDFDESGTHFEMGFPVRPEDTEALRNVGLAIGQTPSGRVMQGMHIGPYETVSATYTAMQEEIGKQGFIGSKDIWERYLSPPETPPAEIRTEVIWPVKERA